MFFANNAGVVYAVSAKTGKTIWHYDSDRCQAMSPAVGFETVYTTFLNHPPCNASSGNGELIAFWAASGKVRWERPLGPSESSPLLVGKRLYLGDWTGAVYCFSATSGRLIWRFQSDGKVKGGVAYSGGRVYFGTYGSSVYALDATTGKQIWKASAQPGFVNSGTFYSTPAIAYDRVYIGSTDGKVYSYGATTGDLRWSQSTGGYVYSSPAVWHERVYAGSYSGSFYCFDAATGAVLWSFKANGAISGSPTVVAGRVYFSTLKGKTYALECPGRQAGLGFPRRQVLARGRRRDPAVPGRLHADLRTGRVPPPGLVSPCATPSPAQPASSVPTRLRHCSRPATTWSAIDCLTDYYDPALKEENARGLDLRRLDLACDELDFAGLDAVFHLAGQPGVRSFGSVFPDYLRRNLLASQRLFEAAVRDGVRVVFASSSSVYGASERYPTPEDTEPRPLSPYGITKLACEQLGTAYEREFGLECVVLRYFNAFGPRQRPDMAFARIIGALLDGTTFRVFGDGDQSRGWTYVDDVVAATLAAADRGHGVYNVGGAIEASLNDAIGLLEQISGRPLELEHQLRRCLGRPAPYPGRYNPNPRRARLVAGGRVQAGSGGAVGVGLG